MLRAAAPTFDTCRCRRCRRRRPRRLRLPKRYGYEELFFQRFIFKNAAFYRLFDVHAVHCYAIQDAAIARYDA